MITMNIGLCMASVHPNGKFVVWIKNTDLFLCFFALLCTVGVDPHWWSAFPSSLAYWLLAMIWSMGGTGGSRKERSQHISPSLHLLWVASASLPLSLKFQLPLNSHCSWALLISPLPFAPAATEQIEGSSATLLLISGVPQAFPFGLSALLTSLIKFSHNLVHLV